MGNCAAEIQNIAKILRKERLCTDVSPLTNGYKKGECNVAKLKFNIKDIPRNTTPSVSILDVLLDLAYKETNNTEIPISQYCFRITAVGQNQGDVFRSSWHLDYDNNADQDYIHPHFHLTWGGRRFKKSEFRRCVASTDSSYFISPYGYCIRYRFCFVKFRESRSIQANSK